MLPLLWLAACEEATLSIEDGGPRALVIPAPFAPPSDLVFLDALVAHHVDGLRMAEAELANGESPEVTALAEALRSTLEEELARLAELRAAMGDPPFTPIEADPIRDRDRLLVESRSGAELDRTFLEVAIPHHAEAIVLAHRALTRLDDPELVRIALDVRAAYARDVGELRDLLDTLAPIVGD